MAPPSPGPAHQAPRQWAAQAPPPPPQQQHHQRRSRDFLEVRQASLFELFDGEAFTFTVPVYQRPYSWKHKQVFELLHDLEAAYNGGREYFLGAIVTTRGTGAGEGEGEDEGGEGDSVDGGRGGATSSAAAASDASFHVIDGQQRLTTLVILLAYLRDWAHRRSTAAAAEGGGGGGGGGGEDPAAAAALAARLRRMLHIDADPLDPRSRPRYRLQLRPADQRFFRENVLESFLPHRYHLAPTLSAADADADGSAAELAAADAAADAVVASAAAGGGAAAGAVASARGGRANAATASSSSGGAPTRKRRGTSRQAAGDDASASAAAAAAAAALLAAEGPPDSRPLASEASWALYSAARYLAAQLDSAAARGLDVPRFVAHVMRGCFVVVMTARDEAASFRIFSTLNGRGVDLSPVDKLKADLLRAVGGGGGGAEGRGGREEEGGGPGGAARRAAYAERWQAAESALGRGAFHRLFDHIRTVEEAAMAYGGSLAGGQEKQEEEEEKAAAAAGGAKGGGGSLFVPSFDLGALFRKAAGGGGDDAGKRAKGGGGKSGGNGKKGGGKSGGSNGSPSPAAATAPSSSFLPLGLASSPRASLPSGGASLGAAPLYPSPGPVGAAGMLDHYAPRTADGAAAAQLLDVLLEYSQRALLIRRNDWSGVEAEGGSGPQVAAELRDACFFAGALRDDAWAPWCLEFWRQVDDDRKRAAFLRGAERLQLYCDLREGGEGGPGYRRARWAAVGAALLARPFYSDRVLGTLALTSDERDDFLARLASRDLASEADGRTLAHLLLRAEWGCRFAAGGGAPGGGEAAAAAAAEADARAQRRRRRVDWRRLRVERVLPQHPPEGSSWRRVRLLLAAGGGAGGIPPFLIGPRNGSSGASSAALPPPPPLREVKYWGYEVLRANWQARLGNLVLLQPPPAAAAAALAAAAAGPAGGGGAGASGSSSDFAAKGAHYRACGGGDALLFPDFTGGVSGEPDGEEEGPAAAAAAAAGDAPRAPSFSRDGFSPDECRARHAALLARLADVFELGGAHGLH